MPFCRHCLGANSHLLNFSSNEKMGKERTKIDFKLNSVSYYLILFFSFSLFEAGSLGNWQRKDAGGFYPHADLCFFIMKKL